MALIEQVAALRAELGEYFGKAMAAVGYWAVMEVVDLKSQQQLNNND